MAFVTLPGAKAQATLLQKRLSELGVSIKKTQANEAIAAIHNFPDWNRFKANLDSAPTQKTRTSLKETKIICAPPGYGKSATLESLLTFHALEGEGIPVYIEMVSEPYRSPFYEAVNRYLGGTDADPRIQRLASTSPQRIEIEHGAKALYVQVPVQILSHEGADALASAIRKVAEAFKRCPEKKPGIIFIDEMHKVDGFCKDLADAFDCAFDCYNTPERYVIATQVYDQWVGRAIKAPFKVIYKEPMHMDHGQYDRIKRKEILSEDVADVKYLFHDHDRMIEDVFQWVFLKVQKTLQCPIPETPIAEKLGLTRWGMSGRVDINTKY